MSEISQKQLEANQQNAKLGGVKTEEGKSITRYNAIKHGILCQEVLLEGEDENSLIELGKKMRAELKPETELELLLVDRIISSTWRLKRALRGEREMIKHDIDDLYISEKNFGSVLSSDLANNDTYGKFTRYESFIERGIYKALHELQRIQSARSGKEVATPLAVDITTDRPEN